MKKLYYKILGILCKRERKRIADKYPPNRDELIRWFDCMAIECINQETPAKERFLGIAVKTAELLENK